MANDDEVRAIRIPRALFDEIAAWRMAESDRSDLTMATTLRKFIERGFRETKRKAKG